MIPVVPREFQNVVESFSFGLKIPREARPACCVFKTHQWQRGLAGEKKVIHRQRKIPRPYEDAGYLDRLLITFSYIENIALPTVINNHIMHNTEAIASTPQNQTIQSNISTPSRTAQYTNGEHHHGSYQIPVQNIVHVNHSFNHFTLSLLPHGAAGW